MTGIDLKKLYEGAPRKNMRLPWRDSIDPEAGSFSALRLSWRDVASKAATQGAPAWTISCDVLVLNEAFVADRPVFIFARRIETEGDADIVLDRASGAQLLLVTQSFLRKGAPAPVSISAVNDTDQAVSKTFELAAGAPCTCIRWERSDEIPTETPVKAIDPAHFLRGGEALTFLKSLFHVASLISTSDPEESCAQLQWIGALAGLDVDGYELGQQAWALASDVKQMALAGKTLFVPPLDVDLYAEQAKIVGDHMRALEAAYQAVIDKEEQNEQWLADAEAAIRLNAEKGELRSALEARAEEAREAAILARTIAARQVAQLQLEMQLREIDFLLGLKRWKEKKIAEGVIKLLFAILEFASAIGTLVTAGDAKPLAKKAENLAEQAKAAGEKITTDGTLDEPDPDLSELEDEKPPRRKRPPEEEDPIIPQVGNEADDPSGKDEENDDDSTEDPVGDIDVRLNEFQSAFQKLDNLPRKNPLDDFSLFVNNSLAHLARNHEKVLKASNAGVKFYEAALGLTKVIQQAYKVEAQSQRILEFTLKTSGAQLGSVTLSGLATVTGGEDVWKELKASVEEVFDKIRTTLEEIEGGPAYRTTFQRLIVAGGYLSRARLAVASATFQLAETKLRSASAQRSAHWLQERGKTAEDMVRRAAEAKGLAFEAMLDARRECCLTAARYRRAFEYFTLAAPADLPPLPAMNGSAANFSTLMTRISARSLSREALAPPPQTLKDLRYRIVDPDVLGAIVASEGTTTLPIPPNAKEFTGLARIRLNRIRIFCEGLSGPEIQVVLASSGLYEDRDRNGAIRSFASAPHRVGFIYVPQAAAGKPQIILDGDIARRFANDFFHPTPFSTWTIRIANRNGVKLDMSGLKALELVFSGEAISLNGS